MLQSANTFSLTCPSWISLSYSCPSPLLPSTKSKVRQRIWKDLDSVDTLRKALAKVVVVLVEGQGKDLEEEMASRKIGGNMRKLLRPPQPLSPTQHGRQHAWRKLLRRIEEFQHHSDLRLLISWATMQIRISAQETFTSPVRSRRGTSAAQVNLYCASQAKVSTIICTSSAFLEQAFQARGSWPKEPWPLWNKIDKLLWRPWQFLATCRFGQLHCSCATSMVPPQIAG